MQKNYLSKDWLKVIRKMSYAMAGSLLAVTGVHAQVSVFPWTETFEDASATRALWTQIYEVNNMSWTFTTQPSTGGTGITAYEGTKMANYPATSHNFDTTKLVSPVLDLSGISNPTLSFFYRNPFWDPDQNWLTIYFRTSEASPWVPIIEYHSNITTWTSTGELALPTPSATYQIAVEVKTDYGYSTVVDALVVNGQPLSVAERSAINVGYYPNPSDGTLNYSSNEKINGIKIFNLLGQKVLDFKIGNNMGQLDVSSLSTGNYIVQAFTDKGTHACKLAKK